MSELVRIAVLGTAQTSGTARTGTDADALLAKLSLDAGRERELALLLAAGAAAELRRAGSRPGLWQHGSVAAGGETLQRASPSLAGLLAGLLQGDSQDLLVEALEGMAAARLRLPEELLPLALGEYDPEVRALLRPVLGERGRWLAEQSSSWVRESDRDDDWSWARSAADPAQLMPANADELWAEGSHDEREELLRLALRVDRPRALAWLFTTFKSDKPEQRRRWIELLDEGLVPADVPFLEAATDDRSAVVRLAATRALWRLEGSAPARGVRERLASLLGSDSRFAPKLPPEPFDAALDKLGIIEAPPEGVGRRQWWLTQLISAVPPSASCERFARSPRELLQLASQHDLALALLDGWTSAALRFDATPWYLPLWDVWNSLDDPSGWTDPSPLVRLTERLAATEAPVELQGRLVECIQRSRHAELVISVPRPWPLPVAEAFIAALARRPAWLSRVWTSAATAIPLAAVPSTLERAAAGVKRHPFDDALAKFLSVIELRQHIAQEIQAQRREPTTPETL